jgi:hypothetical protein
MNTAQINVDRSRFYDIISTLNNDDKMEIYRFLKKMLFKESMENMLNSLKTNDLTMEDITEAVEEVRKERYERGEQIL